MLSLIPPVSLCCILQKQKKPAYIEICCNLAGLSHPSFTVPPIPMNPTLLSTNSHSLAEAVEASNKVSVCDGAIWIASLSGVSAACSTNVHSLAEAVEASNKVSRGLKEISIARALKEELGTDYNPHERYIGSLG